MKKTAFYLLFFLITTALSFGGGIFFAQKKLEKAELSALSKTTIINEADDKINSEEKKDAAIETKKEASEKSESAEEENLGTIRNEEASFSFAVLGDTQYFQPVANGGFASAVRQIESKNPELVFSAGDLVSSCDKDCESKLGQWKSQLRSLAAKTYPAMGNHDRTGEKKSDEAWKKVFNLPANGPASFIETAYFFDLQNSHFVVLNSENPEEHIINGEQRSWLETDLSKNKKENVFVFFHEPAYPVSSKIGESLDVNPSERDALWNILKKHNVTAVFSGHEHIHSRRNIGGIYQFVIGNTDSFDHEAPKKGVAEYYYVGKHFAMVNVKGKEITVEIYSIKGSVLNSFTFSK